MKRKIRVFNNPADYETNFTGIWTKGIVVVFDVLRATSSMITALANGIEKIYPCKTVEEVFFTQKENAQSHSRGRTQQFQNRRL